jgi:ComEC/Rec2-related protein
VSRAAFFRQRLPCLGLFLLAAAGTIAGRLVPLTGGIFALAAALALLVAVWFRARPVIPLALGVGLAFAAAQTWGFRESPAARLATELSSRPQACSARISVLEAPRASESSTAQRYRFTARLERLRIGGEELRPACRVLVSWNGPPPVYGGRYEVAASIANCAPARNPGEFDYAAWLANAGIRSQMQVLRERDVRLLDVGGNPVARFANLSCAWIERTLSLGIAGTPEANLIRAMTIGDTAGTPDALKDAFRETGTFHLFSVSGLHVGIVAVLVWTLLGALGVSQRRSVLIIIPSLFFYALLTGLSPASLRAAIMLSIIAASLLLDRPAVALNSIGAAGFLILLGDSSQLFNSGFQLSFGAVTAIVLLALPVQRRIETLFAPDPFLPTRLIPTWHHLGLRLAEGSAALVAVSFAAWLASLPLTIHYFHLVSLSSIPANLLAVPLASASLAVAAVALVSGLFSPWLAGIFNQANYLLAKLLIFVVNAFAALPGSSFYVGLPQPPGTLATLTVLDAGAGGAQVLLAGGTSWLIDPGPEFFADTVTLPYLRLRGVNELDALVLTHGDIKHIGGAERILATLHPRRIFDSGLPDRSPTRRRILAGLAAAGMSSIRADVGFSTSAGPDAKVSVLFPPPDAIGADADDKALVLRVEIGDFAALLVSDAGLPTEQWLLSHARDQLACDVIAMGRHVSGLSGDPEFLRTAHPRVVIASAADFPEAERIRPAWARAVRALGIDLVRQDETGAVTVTITRAAFIVQPFLPAGGPTRTYANSHATHPRR